MVTLIYDVFMPEGNRVAPAPSATARRLPTLVGVEHVSTTVPDLPQAISFFVDVLGATLIRQTRFEAGPDSDEMEVRFNAHREATARLATLDLHGVILELFQYEAPDLPSDMPRNCDPGGHHVGFRVGDVATAAEFLRSVEGVNVLGTPSYEESGGIRRAWVYFLTPWGLQLEVASEEPLDGQRPPSTNSIVQPVTSTRQIGKSALSTTILPPWPTVAFRPRRLGHVNLYVSNLERSYRFYRDVCGLQLVFDEPGLFAKFLSNGNSHHDVAIMEASPKTLKGRDGQVQKSSDRGTRAGLNHLAFEMPTEARLVDGINRAKAAGLAIESTYDHQISRSVYLPEPDGVSIEIYADSTSEWRELYQSLGDQLLSARWDPGADGPPSETPRHSQTLDHRPVPDAVARPLRTATTSLVVSDLDSSIAFYRNVVGLDVLEADHLAGRWAVLGGTVGLSDLYIMERQAGQALGFHHFSLELTDVDEVAATLDRAEEAGVTVARTFDNALKQSLVVEDPDGLPVEFYAYVEGPGESVTYASVATAGNREFLA
jgi:catechol 2,3-dioxygenase